MRPVPAPKVAGNTESEKWTMRSAPSSPFQRRAIEGGGEKEAGTSAEETGE